MMDSIIDFFLSIIPPAFAILTALCSSTSQSAYFEKAILNVMAKENIEHNYFDLLKNIAVSSVTIVSFITTIFSCFLSLIIIFLKFPRGYSLACGALIILAIIIVFQRWIWEIFSLNLNEISGTHPKKKNATSGNRAFNKFTYTQLFNRRQYYFNLLIIVIIAAGFFFKLNIVTGRPVSP